MPLTALPKSQSRWSASRVNHDRQICLDRPAPAPEARFIYQTRNDDPQGLDRVVRYRSRQDTVIYPLSVPGQRVGWAEDEIDLRPLSPSRGTGLTFYCGAALELREFRVRSLYKSGPDTWLLSDVLPPPAAAERRRTVSSWSIQSSALGETERNIRTTDGKNWRAIYLPDEAVSRAHRLVHQHKPAWTEPIRDVLDGLRTSLCGERALWMLATTSRDHLSTPVQIMST